MKHATRLIFDAKSPVSHTILLYLPIRSHQLFMTRRWVRKDRSMKLSSALVSSSPRSPDSRMNHSMIRVIIMPKVGQCIYLIRIREEHELLKAELERGWC